jgi:hypothetical protein
VSSLLRTLTQLLGWLSVLVSVAGMGVSAFGLGRTRWAYVLLGGFTGEAVIGVFFRLVPRLYTFMGGGTAWEGGYLLASLLSLAAHAAVVAGVAGLLYERSRVPRA